MPAIKILQAYENRLDFTAKVAAFQLESAEVAGGTQRKVVGPLNELLEWEGLCRRTLRV